MARTINTTRHPKITATIFLMADHTGQMLTNHVPLLPMLFSDTYGMIWSGLGTDVV